MWKKTVPHSEIDCGAMFHRRVVTLVRSGRTLVDVYRTFRCERIRGHRGRHSSWRTL